MHRGDVWRIRFPLGEGHVQAGERPGIIVQEFAFNNTLRTTLAIPLTSTLGVARYPGTLSIQPDTQNGLTLPSVALVFQMRALDQTLCLRRLGIVDQQTLDNLLTILDRLTGR